MTPRFALKKTSNGSETELRASMSVGKLDTSDLVLREGLPSRQHARLTLEGDELFVEDLQSRNGTFVNDQRIAARTRLYGGDKVRFDTEEFAVIGPPRVAPVQDDQATQFRAPTPVAPPPVATATRAPTPAAPAPSPAPAPPPAPAPVATAPIAEAAPPRRPAPEAAKAQDRRPPAWLEAGNSDDKTKFVKRKPAPQADSSTEKLDAANVPGAVQVPTLQIISRTGAGNRFELASDGSPRQEWSVGSDATNRIALSDPEISAVHAVISREGSQWKVVDKFSTNGTFVNDQSTVARILAPGDRLRFGTVEARFLLPAGGVFGSLRGPGAPPSSVVKTLGKSRMLWLAAGGFVLMLIAVAVVIKFLM